MEILFEADGGRTSTLVLDTSQIRSLTAFEPSIISLAGPGSPERRSIEEFIEAVYARHYGSTISEHYPSFMIVRDATGELAAAVGLRSAESGVLFLERYLAGPVEAAIGRATGQAVDRAGVVEIGSLASRGGGASIFLFLVLAAYLGERGFDYAVATATRALRRSFALTGIEPVELAAADPARLPDGGASWGRYYQHDPRVLAGAIGPALAGLSSLLPAGRGGCEPIRGRATLARGLLQ